MARIHLMYATLEHPESRDRNDLHDALMSLAEWDNDFNGFNGDEYLWEIAEGYESNAEYLFDTLHKKYPTDDKQLIYEFLCGWLDDDSYYRDWTHKILIDREGNIQHIVVSVLTEE